MGLIETISQLKNQGNSDEQIIRTLSEQGVPPRQIMDALNQSQIKMAVNGNIESGMQPSITNQDAVPMQQLEQNYSTPYMQQQAPQAQQYQEYYPQEGYDQNTGGDSNTIIELAEQVFSEKIKKVQDQLEELNELKTIMQVKVNNLDESVKRMERIIEKLQMSVLDKVGSYGQNLESIKKEMTMMQETFSKTLPSLVKTKK